MFEKIVDEILKGRRLNEKDNLEFLLTGDLEELKKAANKIRQELCGNKVNLCTIINGRGGRCSEDCKFCAQSGRHNTGVSEYPFLPVDEIVNECKRNDKNGVHRFSIVTAGRTLEENDLLQALEAYKKMKMDCPDIALCASHGLLSQEQFKILKDNGVSMYHENIETSRRNFSNICTTHTFDEKIQAIKSAQCAGLEVCSGGIIGLGETWEDRLDMALTLSSLNIMSIPINALIPIKGTPYGELKRISEEDIIRSVIIFRFINPTAYIRLAAGRSLMKDSGKEAFFSGANATITGDMLTTSGNNTAQDKNMLIENGFDISR